jgi:hypothetical protein
VVTTGHHIASYLPAVRKTPAGEEASDMPTHHPAPDSCRYEVRVRGTLGARWAARVDGFSLTAAGDGTTVLAGRTDQAGLHGLLRTLADLGLPLVSVTSADEPSTTRPS